jgi:LPXTG-motif cell wall-anchored protein
MGTPPPRHPPLTQERIIMLAFIGVLLIIWLVVAVLGALIEGLFWLTVVGAVLFLATAGYGYLKRRSRPTR